MKCRLILPHCNLVICTRRVIRPGSLLHHLFCNRLSIPAKKGNKTSASLGPFTNITSLDFLFSATNLEICQVKALLQYRHLLYPLLSCRLLWVLRLLLNLYSCHIHRPEMFRLIEILLERIRWMYWFIFLTAYNLSLTQPSGDIQTHLSRILPRIPQNYLRST